MTERSEQIAVCMLVTDIDAPSGGVQANSRTLLREYARRGMSTFACVRNYYALPADETVDGTAIHRSPVWGRSTAINGVLYLLDTLIWLLRNRRKYDVIHCQQMFGPAMAAAVATPFVRKPVVVRVTTVGDLGEVRHVREMPLARLRLRLLRRVTVWVALTHEMADELTTLDIPDDRINIIHNSSEIPVGAAFEPAENAGMRQRLGLGYKKIAVFVGRLSAEKGLEVLIDAWQHVVRRHADAHLLIVGGGGDYRNVEADLKAQAEALDLNEHIHFVGQVDNAKDFIAASDVFILPSRTEGMSNALVEAFACGASIVASDIAANREICDDGVNAVLVPVGNVEALAGAVSDIFDSPELGRRLGKAARQKAESQLSIDAMVDAYLAVYRKAISSIDHR